MADFKFRLKIWSRVSINGYSTMDIVDATGGWKTSGVGQGYGNGYPLDVLNRWMNKI